jgi:hypothetical protein
LPFGQLASKGTNIYKGKKKEGKTRYLNIPSTVVVSFNKTKTTLDICTKVQRFNIPWLSLRANEEWIKMGDYAG